MTLPTAYASGGVALDDPLFAVAATSSTFELGGGFENLGSTVGRLKVTIATSGKYMIHAHVHVTTDNVASVQESRMRLTKNTVAIADTDTAIVRNELSATPATMRNGGNLFWALELVAGDIIELQVAASTDTGNTSVQSFNGSGITRLVAVHYG